HRFVHSRSALARRAPERPRSGTPANRRHSMETMSASDDRHLGIYSTGRLQSLGMTRHAVRVAVSEARLARIRPGWFHDEYAHRDAVDAVRVGGILTATSCSPHHGMWTLGDGLLHVLVPRNASRLPDRSNATRRVCVHWAKTSISRWIPVADPLQAVVDSAHCQSGPRP